MAAPVVELLNRYKDHFGTTAETLRQRSTGLGDDASKTAVQLQLQASELRTSLEPRLRDTQVKLNQALTDMSPVKGEATTFHFLLDTYLWTAICLLGLGIGQLFGGYLFTYIFGIIFSKWVSLVLTNILLPAYFIMFMRKRGGSFDDNTRRMMMFGLSLALGVLSGHNLSERYMGVMTPPAFMLPLVLAFASEMIGPKLTASRPLFLGGTVGLAAGIYLLIGIILRQFGFTYLLYTLLLTGWAALDLQLTLSMINHGAVDKVAVQLRAVVGTVTIHTLLGFLLGGPKEEAQNTTTQESA